MAVPYTFGTATASIPLSQLDSNFATAITLGNTAIQLGNTVTTLNNMTLANVTISSGNVTLTNVAVTTANVTTANITTAVIGTETVTTSTITTANVTTANITTDNITSGTVSTSLTLSYGTANAVAYLNGSKVVTTGSALTFDGTNFVTTGTATATKLIPTGTSVTGNGMYLPATNAVGISTAGTNAVYIDASQNVGIGTSSPVRKLDVRNSTADYQLHLGDTASTTFGYEIGRETSSGLFKFYGNQTGNTGYIFSGVDGERMRIDSSGNLLVGTNSPASNSQNTIVGVSTSALLSLAVIHNATTNSVRGILTKCPNFNGNDGYLMIGARSGGDVAYMYSNGNWTNLNNSYGALSDIKLKENIADATPKLEKINQVRVVTYNLKSDPSQKQIGVIAQELEQVFPSMVEETADRDAEGNELDTKTKYVKYSVFVPILIKSIQEQQALITTLTARIEALEAK
jgi:Chaperone of endosialidase